MTPEERQLISGLFERMRGYGALEKDRDAEAVISQSVRNLPDAPYMLVQSVLVQEHALQEAGRRIEELEARVRSLESADSAPAPSSGSGSFLGGLLGGGRAQPQQRTSVPAIGSRADAYNERSPAWAQPPQAGQPAQPAAGGGFLRSAMMTAAGVAGGMLAAGAIRDMLGGSSSTAQATPAAASTEAQQAKAEQPQTGSDQSAVQDASHEDSDYDTDSGWGDDMDV